MFESFKNNGQSADRASGRLLGAQEHKGRLDSRQGGSLTPYLRHAAAPGERLDAQFQSGPQPVLQPQHMGRSLCGARMALSWGRSRLQGPPPPPFPVKGPLLVLHSTLGPAETVP